MKGVKVEVSSEKSVRRKTKQALVCHFKTNYTNLGTVITQEQQTKI